MTSQRINISTALSAGIIINIIIQPLGGSLSMK